MTQQAAKKDNDLAYLIMGCVALIAAQRLWMTRFKPWALKNWQAIQAGDWQHRVSGNTTTLDLIGMSILLAPVIVLLLLLRQHSKNQKKKTKNDTAAERN